MNTTSKIREFLMDIKIKVDKLHEQLKQSYGFHALRLT